MSEESDKVALLKTGDGKLQLAQIENISLNGFVNVIWWFANSQQLDTTNWKSKFYHVNTARETLSPEYYSENLVIDNVQLDNDHRIMNVPKHELDLWEAETIDSLDNDTVNYLGFIIYSFSPTVVWNIIYEEIYNRHNMQSDMYNFYNISCNVMNIEFNNNNIEKLRQQFKIVFANEEFVNKYIQCV